MKKDKIFKITLSVIIAILVFSAFLPFIIDAFKSLIPEEKIGPPGDKIYGIGVPVTSDRGTITLTEHKKEDKTVIFTFDKINDQYYGIRFKGYNSADDVFYNIYSPHEYTGLVPYPSEASVVFGGLAFTVNGEEREELPFAIGKYEIAVDYSEIYDFCDEVSSEILIIGFGMFNIE